MLEAVYTLSQRAKRRLLYSSLLKGNCNLGTNVQIHQNCNFELPKNISLGNNVIINCNSMLVAPDSKRLPREHQIVLGDSSYIGHNCYIDSHGGFIDAAELGLGPFCVLYGHGGLTFGKKVIVGAHTTFIAGNHVFSDPTVPIADQGVTYEGITVDDDVWVGAHCLILDGVKIGKHSVIAGGSVVNSDVPAYTLVGGVPAKVIKQIGQAHQDRL